jgi:hypothetical protein
MTKREISIVVTERRSPFFGKGDLPFGKGDLPFGKGDLPSWMGDLPYFDLRREISLVK